MVLLDLCYFPSLKYFLLPYLVFEKYFKLKEPFERYLQQKIDIMYNHFSVVDF